jgi:NAD(P)-dependent dehydrogenase (short-subunit alcohol dehydrogenase family)
MVTPKEILASNALINDATAPRVSIFASGTSGIGQLTLRALVATGASVRIYIVGRKSSEERTRAFIQELHALNPKAEVIWTEGEIALLADVRRICEAIKAKESRVDLLFLTAGYAPFGPRVETAEGIEIAQSLEYYSRMLFVLHLLPLLGQAEAPRVVSVLGGGVERAGSINVDDLDLKKPGNFSGVKAQMQYTAMNSTALEQLASDNPNVTFIHSWPGWVSTGNVDRSSNPDAWAAWLVRTLLGPIIRFFAMSDDTSAQRHLFQSTSAHFGGRGVPWTGKPGINTLEKEENGLFLVNFRGNCTPNAKVMSALREKARDKVWSHTLEVLGPYI